MTTALSPQSVAARINEEHPGAASGFDDGYVHVELDSLVDAARFLKETPDLDFAFLTAITGVDYVEHFELIYHLLSLRHNHSVALKMRCYGRDEPTAPSLVPLWQGADLQEREIWDLLGVRFEGHPNMKRILLWEGFPGHPLRRDFV